jgi:phage shock protein A
MALITRISRLFTADVHAVLDRIEEPEVVLKQAVREMTAEVARGEQQLSWLASESRQLQQRQDDLRDQIGALNDELDLCFQADEEDLARSLVKRKLIAQMHLKQVTQTLESMDRDHAALADQLNDQRLTLAETRQKTELLIDNHVNAAHPGMHSNINNEVSKDAIDVAFLKEKQRRQA